MLKPPLVRFWSSSSLVVPSPSPRALPAFLPGRIRTPPIEDTMDNSVCMMMEDTGGEGTESLGYRGQRNTLRLQHYNLGSTTHMLESYSEHQL
ncbi:uncharacterized protein BDZ99DRAFT_154066 [Mytilinidion resinicola]|uniref:Uncharacterized protein n=1 Tax=Mytilinidion resinicola TaxID=574789 RepID=A0A6A6Y6H6_9PEZI|nr:uncharacterized protein BDZ99DRAFT_154066 [Mytilinidion resinicola]KAF2804209.1 hypothetical protein BDZ99DRAFT_154066 [Mytilinidion resinicola]